MNDLYVVWPNYNDSTGNLDVFFRKSTDGGNSFGETINLSNNPSWSTKPEIAVSGSNVYVVWIDQTQIFFRKSTDGGNSFGETINLSNSNITEPSDPQIAVSGSNVYVVWNGDVHPTSNGLFHTTAILPSLMFRKSTDGGNSFEETINLSNSNIKAPSDPQIAVSGSNVYVVWNGNVHSNSIATFDDVFFKTSKDGGNSFGETINLSNNPENVTRLQANEIYVQKTWKMMFAEDLLQGSVMRLKSTTPQIAVSGSNVYVVWTDVVEPTQIHFKKSSDNGINFENTTNLSKFPEEPITDIPSAPHIAAIRNFVYVIWEDKNIMDKNKFQNAIFFKKSSDNGINFENTTNLSKNDGNSKNPQIYVDGRNVYVAWENSTPESAEIFFRESTNNGMSFGYTINLSKNGHSNFPRVAAAGNNAYVVWHNRHAGFSTGGGDDEICFRHGINTNGFRNSVSSNYSKQYDRYIASLSRLKLPCLPSNATLFDKTLSFGNPTQISEGNFNSTDPAIATAGNNVYVVWMNNTLNNETNILFRASANNGITFGKTVEISDKDLHIDLPQIAAAGNNVYVVWRENNVILFRASANNGITFGKTVEISDKIGNADFPRVAAAGNNVYVVWRENNVILFRASANNGITFGKTVEISDKIGNADFPRVAAAGNNVYVVWRENTTGIRYTEIFYKRSLDTGRSFSNAIDLSNDKEFSEYPEIFTYNGYVFVVWVDFPVFSPEAFELQGFTIKAPKVILVASNYQGADFGGQLNILGDKDFSEVSVGFQEGRTHVIFRPNFISPQVSISSGIISIVWYFISEEHQELEKYLSMSVGSPIIVKPVNNEIYFVQFEPSKLSYGKVYNLSNITGNSINPKISTSDNNTYVIWTHDSSGVEKIYGRRINQS
jgi:hypothetical protein